MIKEVLRFQEEASSIRNIPDLQAALTRIMTWLGFPFFSYAWSVSPHPDQLHIDNDSFLTTITNQFFVPYIQDGIFRHDYSIHACRGTTTIPSLVGRSCHRWREVPVKEMNQPERNLDEIERMFFADGFTSTLETRSDGFFSGASLVGQGMSLREFEHALNNAGNAFLVLRIFHVRYHSLRRESPTATDPSSNTLQKLLAEFRSRNLTCVTDPVAEVIAPGLVLPEKRVIVPVKYEIKAAVVNIIEHNTAPISIGTGVEVNELHEDSTPDGESSGSK